MGTVATLDQGDGDEEYTDFWSYLGSEGEIGPAMDDGEEVAEFAPLLFRVDGNPEKYLEKVATGITIQRTSNILSCLKRSALDEDDVFLLDTGWEIYIWVGKCADTSEKVAAMGAADRYGKMEPRAADLPVTLIKSGRETDRFNSYFYTGDVPPEIPRTIGRSKSLGPRLLVKPVPKWQRSKSLGPRQPLKHVPTWQHMSLRATGSGAAAKQGENLAAPITFTPFKNEDHSNKVANQQILRRSQVGEAAREGSNLAAPVTFSPFKNEDHSNKVARPDALRRTDSGTLVRGGGNLAMPITNIRESWKTMRKSFCCIPPSSDVDGLPPAFHSISKRHTFS
jgi:hypothetical protein